MAKHLFKKCVILMVIIMQLIFCINVPVNAEENESTAKSSQDFANVILFAYFSDETNKEYFNDAFDASYTNAGKIMYYYDGNYNFSFTNYLNTVSNGQFNVHNVFPQLQADGKVNAIELPQKKTDAQSKNIDYSIVNYVINNSNIDLSNKTVDYNGDGIIDNLTIILLGSADNNVNGAIPSLYPHQSYYSGNDKISGYNVSSYNMLNTARIVGSGESGVICHEFLHTLGFQDLYTSSSDSFYPVGGWDIMSKATKYLTWPLAYTRMYYQGWTNLETITKSKTNVQIAKSGDQQAYVIQSPLNPYELFVVERRTKGTASSDYDYVIGGSGLIVYRVDTTVDGLSNYFGKTGIYVFRPNGESADKGYLSQESGRTSIGSNDLNAGLEVGALTFSDGSNSGIVISNVSSTNGEYMTFDVEVPDTSLIDSWQNIEITDKDYTDITMINFDDSIIALSNMGNSSQQGKIQFYNIVDGSLVVDTSFSILSDSAIIQPELFKYEGKLGLAYLDENSNLKVKIYDNGWQDLFSKASVQNYDIKNSEDETALYFSYVNNDYNKAYFCAYEQNIIKNYKELSGSIFTLMIPEVIVDGSNIYYAIKNSDNLEIYKINGDSADIYIDYDQIKNYHAISYNGSIYVSICKNDYLEILKMQNSNWIEIFNDVNFKSYAPKLAVAQGNLYLLNSSGVANDGLYVYEVKENKLIKEGLKVDSDGTNYSMIAVNDTLYVGYLKDYSPYIKQKTTANKLLSLSITPPAKTTYALNEEFDLTGLEVFANYVKDQRQLNQGEYVITDIDTSTAGDKTATVSFGGLSNTFNYSVYADDVSQNVINVSIDGFTVPNVGDMLDQDITVGNASEINASISWNQDVTQTVTYEKEYVATITVEALDGYHFNDATQIAINNVNNYTVIEKTASTIKVQISYLFEAADLTVDKNEIELSIGDKITIVVTDPTGSALTWKSNDASIATVNNGEITAVGKGTTTVIVSNEYGKSAEVKVTVIEEQKDIEISQIDIAGLDEPQVGNVPDTSIDISQSGIDYMVSWNTTVFDYGTNYTVSIILKPQEGYVFASDAIVNIAGLSNLQIVTQTDNIIEISYTYEAIPVPDIAIYPNNIEMVVGEVEKVAVTDASGSTLSWSITEGNDVISLDAIDNQTYRINALAAGNAVVSVENIYGKQAQVAITVKEKENPDVSEIINDIYLADLDKPIVGELPDYDVDVLTNGIAINSINWDSFAAGVPFSYQEGYKVSITMALNGNYDLGSQVNVHVADIGDYTIVPTEENSMKIINLEIVFAGIAVPEIDVMPENLELIINQTANILVINAPINGQLEWKSNDQAIATVENGLVTAISQGTTTITVSDTIYNKSKTINVTVKAEEIIEPDNDIKEIVIEGITKPTVGQKPDLTPIVNNEGLELSSISWNPDHENFKAGTTYTLTLKLKVKDGYNVKDDLKANISGAQKTNVYIDGNIITIIAEFSIPNETTSDDKEEQTSSSTNGTTNGWIDPTNYEITNINISGLQLPKIGITQDKEVFVDHNGVNVKWVEWYPMGEKVNYDQPYTLWIYLTAKEGYWFNEDVKATIDGVNNVKVDYINYDEITLQVDFAPIKQTTYLSLNITELELFVGDNSQLLAEGSNKINWSTADDTIATVDSNGLVTAISPGMVQITATDEIGNSALAKITVKEKEITTEDNEKTEITSTPEIQDNNEEVVAKPNDNNLLLFEGIGLVVVIVIAGVIIYIKKVYKV